MATDAEVGRHLDLSDRSVRALKSKGVLPDAPRGQMDIEACRLAYIRHLREQAAGRSAELGPKKLDLMAEKARDAKESADARAMKNAVARGELVPAGALSAAIIGMIEMAKARMLRVPAIVAKGDTALLDRIDRAIRDGLEDLSATRVETVAGEEDDGGDEPADDAPDDVEG
jgi:phage terminase Nu1 subunit (DNA packaging protein)